MPSQTQAPRAATTPPILAVAEFLADPVDAATFPQHILRWRHDAAAQTVGLAQLSDAAWVDHFGRFVPLDTNLPKPLALRYHGHQFGTYNPELGDGRGFLFAQLPDDEGRWLDLGTKGSGQTPYSRFGDGRLTLKGAVRELLATEMLEALGVPTSRTFSIIETGESLHRGDEPSPTRSAVLVRLNHSHIRIGSFQRLAALGQPQEMERLVRYVLTVLYGMEDRDVDTMTASHASARLVRETAQRTARMVAAYMVAGFVHGVLNTDNINVTGESFDYGPWRFTPKWDPGFTAAYFDHQSLYAFGRQPQVMHWNIGQLALALRLIADAPPLTAALEQFGPAYDAAIARQFCWRLGVAQDSVEADRALVLAAEQVMRESDCDIDAFFVDPQSAIRAASTSGGALAAALDVRATLRGDWAQQVQPQSLHIEEVEALWDAIAQSDDWRPLYAKIDAIRSMGAAMRMNDDVDN